MNILSNTVRTTTTTRNPLIFEVEFSPKMNEVTLISDLSIDEKIPLNHENRGAMTIYFASMGENLWDISRRYHASVNDVKSINNIGDLIDADKMIMIPIG